MYAAGMSVSVSVLASGSRGNSALVESSKACILVDAGISCRETFKRLKSVGRNPREISAILITHEHSDHVYGLAVLAKKIDRAGFVTGAPSQAWARGGPAGWGEGPEMSKVRVCFSVNAFEVRELSV